MSTAIEPAAVSVEQLVDMWGGDPRARGVVCFADGQRDVPAAQVVLRAIFGDKDVGFLTLPRDAGVARLRLLVQRHPIDCADFAVAAEMLADMRRRTLLVLGWVMA